MNYTVEICSALIENRKLRLISALADTVGINERECRAQLTSLCADGTLRVDRDYVLINDEAKAKRVAKGAQPPTKDETRVAARMAANAKASGSTVAAKRERQPPVDVPVPSFIKIEKGIPIPAKRWGKVAAVCPWPFLEMEVGDSFAVPVPDDMKPTQVAGTLRKAATSVRRTVPGLRVTIRTELGDKTVRCWRDPDAESNETPAPSPAARASKGIRLPIDKRPGTSART
jgi:hypothetical protein